MRQLMLSLLLVVLWAPSAFAGLCKAGNIESRHNREAENLERENFAMAVSPVDGTSDYIGSRTYNAHVLACNRKRDTMGNKIEKDIGSDHVFEANLAPRLVKGHYNYFGNIVTQQRYMYRLERTNGNWIVTIPAEFHFPELKLTKFLDITMPLADRLGIAATVCATTVKSGGKTTRGLVPKSVGNGVWTDDTCRVGRDESFTVAGQTKDIKDWYMDFWKELIQSYWSRPGFELRFQIINRGEVASDDLAAYKKEDIVWHVRLNMNANVAPRYKSNPLFLHPIYSGIDRSGIVHEFGHVLGLDDEYPSTECAPLGGTDYIMCGAFTLGGDNQKAIYPWIVTRRYVVGKAL